MGLSELKKTFYVVAEGVGLLSISGSGARHARVEEKYNHGGKTWNYYRHAMNGAKFLHIDFRGEEHAVVVFTQGKPSAEGIITIDLCCDNRKQECEKNRGLKIIFARALEKFFKTEKCHVTDLGCGHHPIATHFAANLGGNNMTFHGIDIHECAVHDLLHKGFSASLPETAPPRPAGKTAVATGIYSLGFMADKISDSVLRHTSENGGFYVGNYYFPQGHGNSSEVAKNLKAAGLAYITLKDPRDPTNEYWIAGRPDSYGRMDAFAKELASTYGTYTYGAQLQEFRWNKGPGTGSTPPIPVT